VVPFKTPPQPTALKVAPHRGSGFPSGGCGPSLKGKMQSANSEPGSFRGDPAAGRAGFEITKRVLFLAFLIGIMLIRST
jgi:hypothetical protein